MKKRELRWVRNSDGEVVKRLDITGHSDHNAEKILLGALRNLSENYRIEDSDDDRKDH